MRKVALWIAGLGLLPARHIAGADLYYRCLQHTPSSDTYEFELWLYRDCTDPEGANYDNPLYLYIFRGDGTLYQEKAISLTSAGPWNPEGVDACFLQRPGTCLEEGVYRFQLELPVSASGYYVAWARCCRNAAITNLQNPLYMGITYLARIPPARRATCNTSPVFRRRPPFFLCAGRDFYFDHSATDADGDSLAYALVPAYHSVNTQGVGAVNPAQGGSPVVSPANPMGPPPYQTVTYAPGYSATQPFGPGGICTIDPVTGRLHLRAPNPGLYVVALAVYEYRNGQFLGETRRDMQFYVAPCRDLSPPPVLTHDFGSLLHQGDTLLIVAETPFCVQATLTDTAPPPPPVYLSWEVSPSFSVQASGTNPLQLQLCGRLGCQDTGKVLLVRLTGIKTETCGSTLARDSFWIAVLAPPPRTLTGSVDSLPLPRQNGVYLLPLDSTACVRFFFTARPPTPPPEVTVLTDPPGVQTSLSTQWQRDTLFGQVCYTGGCEGVSQPVRLILRGWAEGTCPPYPAQTETLAFRVVGKIARPVALFLPPTRADSPFVALIHGRYCFSVGVRDTGRNGGPLSLTLQSSLPVSVSPQESPGDSLVALFCFQPSCSWNPDSVYALVFTAMNAPPCAEPPPPGQDTFWVRPQPLPQQRPPVLSRDRPSPWEVDITGDTLCYTIRITDPDSLALLALEFVGAAFSPDFYYGSHFQPTVSGSNPLYVRLCARLNCYAQMQTYPVIVCVNDTTACEPEKRWRVCDTLWMQTRLCHGLIPNVFTPNGDGFNDEWRPYALAGIADWRLEVWDRWGQQVFSGQWNEPWNGQTPQGPALEGTYFYRLTLRLLSGSGPPWITTRTGSVTLLR